MSDWRRDMEEIIAKVYASLIGKDLKTIDNVPEPLREKVLELCGESKGM